MSTFFSGIAQEELALRQYTAKAPLFFRDVHMMGVVFTADLACARALMPTERHHPLRILPGRAVVALHCMEYRQCDIGPYNEVSLSIAIEHGVRSLLPGPMKLLRSLWTGIYHAWIQELPVTTDVALIGGIDIFNFPKYLAEISFAETDSERTCTLRDTESGETILELKGEKIPARLVDQEVDRTRLDTITLCSYPRMGEKTLHSRMFVNRVEHGSVLFGRRATLTVGEHPRARVFRDLGIGRQLQYIYAPRCEAMLVRPEVCE